MKKLYYGGDIITMACEGESVEAVLVDDGIIQEVGNVANFENLMNDSTIEKVDLNGHTMLPGFVDPHGHISVMVTVWVMADVSACERVKAIIDTLTLRMKCNGLGKSDSVVGMGYDHNFLIEETHPRKEILNQVSTENPIFVSHASGHVGCANDAALKLVGIDEHTEDEEGGHIGRVDGTNEPNGYLEEGGMAALRDKMYLDLNMDFVELALLGQDMYIKNGITTAQDGATSSEILAMFQSLAEKDRLKIDIVTYPTVADNPDDMWKYEKYA